MEDILVTPIFWPLYAMPGGCPALCAATLIDWDRITENNGCLAVTSSKKNLIGWISE